jgi:hypothetical protein
MTDELTAKLRVRAYELADTGRFSDWDGIAAEMEREEIPDVLVRRIGAMHCSRL